MMGIFGPPNIEKMKAKKNVKGLVRALKHENTDIRDSSLEALTAMGWQPRGENKRAHYSRSVYLPIFLALVLGCIYASRLPNAVFRVWLTWDYGILHFLIVTGILLAAPVLAVRSSHHFIKSTRPVSEASFLAKAERWVIITLFAVAFLFWLGLASWGYSWFLENFGWCSYGAARRWAENIHAREFGYGLGRPTFLLWIPVWIVESLITWLGLGIIALAPAKILYDRNTGDFWVMVLGTIVAGGVLLPLLFGIMWVLTWVFT